MNSPTLNPKLWIYKKDSTKNKFFKFNSLLLSSSAVYQNGLYFNQNTSNFIFRNTGRVSYSILGLPLNNTFFLINENGNFSHGINRFTLSFDRAEFQKQWRQNLQKVGDAAEEEKQSIYKQINILRSESDSINYLLKNVKDSSITTTQNSLNDSLYSLSEKQLYVDSLNIELKKKQQTIESLLYAVKQFGRIDSLKKSRSVSPSDLRKMGTKPSFIQKVFANINTFEIGTFTPRYPEFLLSGLPITGSNFEGQFQNIYLAASFGSFSLAPNFGASNFNQQESKDGRIKLLRVGLGNAHSNHIHISYLHAVNNKPYENRFYFNGSELQESSVFHISSRYNFSKVHYAETELATSFSRTSYEALALSSEKVSFSPLTTPNSAYSIKLGSKYPNTKVEVEVSKIGNTYYSLGSPFMRRDIFIMKGSLSKYFLKKQLQISGTISADKDNLSKTKAYTNLVNNAFVSARLNLRKLPSVIVSYSTNKSVGAWSELNTVNSYVNDQKSIGILHNFTVKQVRVSLSANYNTISIQNNFSSLNNKSSISLITVNSSIDYKNFTILNTFLRQETTGLIQRSASGVESNISYRSKKNTLGVLIGTGSDNFMGKKLTFGCNLSGQFFNSNKIQFSIRKTYFTGSSITIPNPLTINLNITQKF